MVVCSNCGKTVSEGKFCEKCVNFFHKLMISIHYYAKIQNSLGSSRLQTFFHNPWRQGISPQDFPILRFFDGFFPIHRRPEDIYEG